MLGANPNCCEALARVESSRHSRRLTGACPSFIVLRLFRRICGKPTLRIPDELFDAARTDGASEWHILADHIAAGTSDAGTGMM